MSDPRNVAHAKKVHQEKKHQAAHTAADDEPTGQPGKKTAVATRKNDPASTAQHAETTDDSVDTAAQPSAPSSAALEASLVVLVQLKDLDFHSRGHLERLEALQMTVEDELKQKDMVGPISEVYAAQSTFQTRLTTLIDLYKVECDRMLDAGA